MNAGGSLEGRRILLVEDSYVQAMDTSEWLAEEGAQIIGPAPNAANAIGLLASEPIDAAVLDINLGSGVDYTIAASLSDRGVPFVFATGYDGNAIDPRFQEVPRIVKPVSKEILLKAIKLFF